MSLVAIASCDRCITEIHNRCIAEMHIRKDMPLEGDFAKLKADSCYNQPMKHAQTDRPVQRCKTASLEEKTQLIPIQPVMSRPKVSTFAIHTSHRSELGQCQPVTKSRKKISVCAARRW